MSVRDVPVEVVYVNGAAHPLPETPSLAELLKQVGIEAGRGGVAVAVDAQVVPRHQWLSWMLRGGEKIEILHAVQGG